MNGNPTTAAPGDYDDDQVVFNGPGIINEHGELNVTTTTANGGGGGGGGSGGNVLISGGSGMGVLGHSGVVQLGSSDAPTVQTWSSVGGYVNIANSPEVEELKGKIKELEKAENDRKDIEYFRRNLHKALKVPANYMSIPKTTVGPDDILIVHIGVKDIPANRIESYIKRAKEKVQSAFDERGLKDRVLWCPVREGTDVTFAVIGVEAGPEMSKIMKEAVDYAKATATWKPSTLVGAVNELKSEKGLLSQKDIETARAALRARKRKYPPPVMG